ncbi:MAG: hypothetical protein HFF12_02795 [Angelakisella sp.]|nr:hypothetical protein [Angelakisella sp.]
MPCVHGFGIVEDISALPALEEIVLSDRRIQTDEQLVELSRLIREAIRRGKYMIHYGV